MGRSITYDAIGNPRNYYNGTAYTFTWQGRQLKIASTSGKTMSFTYNDEGIRTSKTVNGVTTTYYLNGSRIIGEATSEYLILYLYDAESSPIGMEYRALSGDSWQTYLYEKNLQGDIVAVYSEAGTKLATYTYDAWGNFSTTYTNGGANTPAAKNPFTYRGYYLDRDLGLYYLNSRYYDSATCRFVNADGYVSTGQGIIGNNMYAYCGNNPVLRIDITGEGWDSIWNGAKKLAKNIGQSAVEFVKSVELEVGLGCGVGVDASANVFGVVVEAALAQTSKVTYTIDSDGFDSGSSTGFEAGFKIGKWLDINFNNTKSHSFDNPLCNCTNDDSFMTMSECPANSAVSTEDDIVFGFSTGAYLGLGADVSFGLNLSRWWDKTKLIFEWD